MNTVTLSVRSQLLQVVEELNTIARAAENTSEHIRGVGESVGKTTEKQIKNTETFLGKLRGLLGRVAEGMKNDFSALMSFAGITEGLKLGKTFSDNVRDTMELSNAIRKLGSVFGLAESEFVGFQTRLTKGLGDIGLSSEAAVSALKGLSETQVRGQEQLTEYAKAAGQVAVIAGQKGQEGAIAKGMANVITARGGNVNDLSQMREVANSLRQAFGATGKMPTDVLQSLEHMLAQMPIDLRKEIGAPGLIKLATTAQVAGPGATKFLEEYLSKSPIARKALEARGFKGVFGPQGLDTKRFGAAAKGVIDQYPGDPRLMAQTLGLTEDAAEGFIRLYESLDRVDEAQQKMTADTRDMTEQYTKSMTAQEAFAASLNKFKSSLAKPISFATDALTRGLQGAFKLSLQDIIDILPYGLRQRATGARERADLPEAIDKNLGSTALVAGGGVLAAMLTGRGLAGLLKLGKGKAEGVAERVAYEKVTGKTVQDVYVVNAAEIGNAAGAASGPMGTVGKVAAVGGAFAGGYAVGTAIQELFPEFSAFLDNIAGDLGESYAKAFPKATVATPETDKIKVQENTLAPTLSTPTIPVPRVPEGLMEQKAPTVTPAPATPTVGQFMQQPAQSVVPKNIFEAPTAAPISQAVKEVVREKTMETKTEKTNTNTTQVIQSSPQTVRVDVTVGTRNRDLTATARPMRGATV